MKAFEIKVNGKILDYRKSENLDLEKVKKFFEKTYVVKKNLAGKTACFRNF